MMKSNSPQRITYKVESKTISNMREELDYVDRGEKPSVVYGNIIDYFHELYGDRVTVEIEIHPEKIIRVEMNL